ncbi:MAG: response regulator [Actinobacteria bacterium]|nr:response regulator [Actinomycetota bacterium]
MGQSPEVTTKTRVLVIDDDLNVVEVLCLMLRTKGFDVLRAYRGIEGFNVARRELPDVILLDIMMPDIDGYEVYRRLRLDQETRGIPVIFVSARSQDEDVQKGLSSGAQGYIVKPFRAAVLVDKIKEVVKG